MQQRSTLGETCKTRAISDLMHPVSRVKPYRKYVFRTTKSDPICMAVACLFVLCLCHEDVNNVSGHACAGRVNEGLVNLATFAKGEWRKRWDKIIWRGI